MGAEDEARRVCVCVRVCCVCVCVCVLCVVEGACRRCR